MLDLNILGIFVSTLRQCKLECSEANFLQLNFQVDLIPFNSLSSQGLEIHPKEALPSKQELQRGVTCVADNT